MYQAESDPMIRGGTMQALGKYVVFQIINPIANSSFRMALSSSFLPQQDFKLPRARLIGDKVYRIDVVGRGSARVVNSMVEPKRILSRDFIQLTLDSEPLVFKNNNFGLLGLYNSEIPFDPRLISVFGRQIDLVPPNSIIKAPSRISDFAQDFRNPNFVYSGIYEDGWLSEESYFLLKPPDDGTFIIKGTIPLLANTQFKTKMRISVDGEVVEEHILGPGEFSLEFPAPVKATSYEKAKIGISFSEWQRLPLPDNRPIAALLKSVLP
jgi:hypothetical protein